jgi:DNA-binding response OmpR family regulator
MRSRLAMIADSDAEHRRLVASALRAGGFLMVEPASEDEVISMAVERSPDVVLLDLDFAGASGWRIVKALQGDHSTCDIPVIALSREDLLAEADRLWKSGFCGYLKKPVAEGSLLAAIRFCLMRIAEGADWVDLSRF